MNAHEVVDVLLEAIRVCADCQQEFGTTPAPGSSHGYCRRHGLARYTDALGSREAAEQALAGKPDSMFAPDMAQERNAQPAPGQPPPGFSY